MTDGVLKVRRKVQLSPELLAEAKKTLEVGVTLCAVPGNLAAMQHLQNF